MKISTIIRKITAVVGAANMLMRVKAGVRLAMRGTLLVPQKVAVKLGQLGTLTVPQKAAVRIAAFLAGAFTAIVKSGLRLAQIGSLTVLEIAGVRASMAPALLWILQKPAIKISQVSFNLVHGSWVVTAAQDAGGTGTWNNPTRMQAAAQGTQAGSATFSGGLILGTGKLRGTMVAQSNRPTSLIIDEVYLEFSGETTGLPVVSDLISNLQLGYRINTTPIPGVDTTLEQLESNQNFFIGGSGGKLFRINRTGADSGKFTDGATAAVSTDVTWANIARVQPYFSATTIATGAMDYYADAVRLTVIAHEDWLP